MSRRFIGLWLGLWLCACADPEDNQEETDAAVEPGGARNDASAAPGSADGGSPATGSDAAQSSDASGSGSSDAALGGDARGPGSSSDAGPSQDAGGSGDAAQPSTDAGPGPGPGPDAYKLDCGGSAVVLESAGPPKNRINYIIAGDGYTEADLGTTYMQHLNEMLKWIHMPALEPYTRYRKFINICALKVASPMSGIGTTRGNSAFGGYGNDETRLGYIEDAKVRDAMTRLLPKEIEVDWVAVVLNGNRWWNAGGRYMVWSGGHKDAGLAAMHEGGHSFQLLADEYGGNCTFSGDEARMRINVTKDSTNTAGKWSKWLDFTQTPGTGKQGIFEGGQYCDKGAFRPSQESVMNMLWDSSYFNAISLEQAVRVIYKAVKPIDSSTPTTVTAPGELVVDVVDPAVVKLEWFVDDQKQAATGRSLDVPGLKLASGMHTVRARAYDDTPWVRGDRKELEQSVSWTIQVP
ncbi:MAG TPA: M64 family metallopeptidase [Polyangiales bacterium]